MAIEQRVLDCGIGVVELDVGELLVVTYFSAVNIFFSCIGLARNSKEDIALRNQFGEKWDDWAKKVPYSIFPRIY